MKQYFEFTNFESSAKDQEAIDKIIDFIQTESMDSMAISTAYQIALGVIPVEKEQVFEESIYRLAKILDEAMNSGLPINKIPQLAEAISSIENASQTFEDLLNILKINNYDAQLLKSVIKTNRKGVLVAYIDGIGLELFKVDLKEINHFGFDEMAKTLQFIKFLRTFVGTPNLRFTINDN